jgi:hypothetical protein
MTYAARGVVGQRERDSGHTEAFGGPRGGAVKTQAGGRTRPAFDLQIVPASRLQAERATGGELRSEAHGEALVAATLASRVGPLSGGEEPLPQPGSVAALSRLEARNVQPLDADSDYHKRITGGSPGITG